MRPSKPTNNETDNQSGPTPKGLRRARRILEQKRNRQQPISNNFRIGAGERNPDKKTPTSNTQGRHSNKNETDKRADNVDSRARRNYAHNRKTSGIR